LYCTTLQIVIILFLENVPTALTVYCRGKVTLTLKKCNINQQRKTSFEFNLKRKRDEIQRSI
jgi:hypothetical protein